MAIMQNSTHLFDRVMRKVEEREEEAKPMLEAWKQGHTEVDFRVMNGEDLWSRDYNRNVIPNHCKKHDLWLSTIVAHERQFQDLADCGMPAVSMIGASEATEWTVFFLKHKTSKCHLHRNLILYSNGMMSQGHEYGYKDSGGSGGAWLPYYLDSNASDGRGPIFVSDYTKIIEEIYQEGIDWIDKNFKDKPQVKKKMLASLNEQMNHDRFRGLHWKN